MPFTPTEKEQILDALMSTRRQGQIAEVSLRLQGDSERADEVWASTSRLSTEIDVLIGRMMDDWRDRAGTAMTALIAAHGTVSDAVAAIRRRTKTADSVTKVIGGLDKAIGVARMLMAGL